jgi:hypothetical protein
MRPSDVGSVGWSMYCNEVGGGGGTHYSVMKHSVECGYWLLDSWMVGDEASLFSDISIRISCRNGLPPTGTLPLSLTAPDRIRFKHIFFAWNYTVHQSTHFSCS